MSYVEQYQDLDAAPFQKEEFPRLFRDVHTVRAGKIA
jgi:hypothetical protein